MQEGAFLFYSFILGGALPNYYPNSFAGLQGDSSCKEACQKVSGDVQRHDSANDDNFEQVTSFWTNVLSPEERDRLVANIAGHLQQVTVPAIVERSVANFEKVHPDFGAKLRLALNLVKVSASAVV